jgi:hypothetical protein
MICALVIILYADEKESVKIKKEKLDLIQYLNTNRPNQNTFPQVLRGIVLPVRDKTER